MVRVSKFKLKEEHLNKLFSLFFEVVGKHKDKEEFLRTIEDIFSSTERIVVAKRIAIIYLLMQDIDTIVICQTLKVSSATVAKFKILTEKSMGAVPTFKKILRNEKLALFILKLFDSLYPPGTPSMSWKGAWERRKAIEKKKHTGF